MIENGTYSQSGLKVYFCGKENCQPGHYFGPTVRPHYLLHVVLDGKGIYQYKGVTYHLKKGDAFLIPPMEMTYYRADSVTPWSYAWVGFDGKFCPELFSKTVFENSYVFKNPNPAQNNELADCMKQLLKTFSDTPGDTLKSAGLLMILFSCMPKKMVEKNLDGSAFYWQKAREYIEDNYAYPVQISDVARYVGINRTYLYRIFMECEKMSPKQYLLRYRIRVATEMLSSLEYSITEIAFSCGFKDTSSFSNSFRQAVGCTPREFRKYIKEECE